MGLRIGDSARNLPTFQSVGTLQGREPLRQRGPARPSAPVAEASNRRGILAPVDRDETAQQALREPVTSGPAAAVRALGANFRAIRAQQPTIEERREQVRERFEQAREQVFGRAEERAVARQARTDDLIETREEFSLRTRENSDARETQSEEVRTEPEQRDAPRIRERETLAVGPPTARDLERFGAPPQSSEFDLRG